MQGNRIVCQAVWGGEGQLVNQVVFLFFLVISIRIHQQTEEIKWSLLPSEGRLLSALP